MSYRLTRTWSDPHMQKLADWTREMMDCAGPTAAGLGCSKEAIIAQAALESNWGQTAIGHNLFGIRADASWRGATRTVQTREVVNGQEVYGPGLFRDYPTYAESIADHFAFLKANSRYAAAGVFNAGSDRAYFEALQRAGYATDPNYATALMNMLASVKMFTASMVDEAAVRPVVVPPMPATIVIKPAPDPVADFEAPPPEISPPVTTADFTKPPDYIQTASGNVIRADISQSTIVQGANHGAIMATAGTVASVGAAASSFAGLDWKVIAALGAVAALGGVLAIVYLLLVKSRRIDMHDKGIA